MKETWKMADNQREKEWIRLMFDMELYSLEKREEFRIPVQFSKAFYGRMDRLIKKERQKGRIKRTVRYFLSIAAVFLLILCLMHPEYIAKARDVMINWFSSHVEIRFSDMGTPETISEYELTYVPEGFVITGNSYDERFGGVVEYENRGKYITFMYSPDSGSNHYDNEHSEISVLSDADGNEIYFVEYGTGGYSMLWQMEDKVTFSLDADVAKEEMFLIKEGIKGKK